MFKIMRNQTFLLAAAGILSALVLLAFLYRDGLAAHIVDSVSKADEEYARQFIGKPAPGDFTVTIAEGDEIKSIRDVLDKQALVMTYRENCSACRSAVNHYLALKRGRLDYGSTVYLLVDKSEQRIPAGFPAAQFLRMESVPVDHMFKGRASPRIYRFAESGSLADVMIGHQDLPLEAWLGAMFGE